MYVQNISYPFKKWVIEVWWSVVGQRGEAGTGYGRKRHKVEHRVSTQATVQHDQQLLEGQHEARLGRIAAQAILQNSTLVNLLIKHMPTFTLLTLAFVQL